MSRHRSFALAMALCTSSVLLLSLGTPAVAAPVIKVSLTVQGITALSSAEEGLCGSPDWYVKVSLAGRSWNNEDSDEQDDFEGNPDIAPDWEFSVPDLDVASLTTPGRVPFRVEAWDEDGGLCLGDEHYDTSPTADRAVEGYIDLGNCTVHDPRQGANAYLGDCGNAVVQAGTDEDRARLTIMLQATPPASAPGLRVRCTHTPVWPQPGQAVTITATALDGVLAPTVLADSLEIWLNPDPDVNSSRAPTASVSGAGSVTHVFTPSAGSGGFAYGCRLREGADEIFSSWHRTTVGDPFPNFTFPKPAVPVLYTGPRSSRIDIAFVVDRDSYSGALDPQFQTDLASVIATSYYGLNEFLAEQDKFNFWLLTDNTGRADDANDGDCDHDLPALWDDVYSFADAGAILHRKNQRDCALRGDRIFSGVVDPNVRSDALQVITHETGHQPFGLADEYCCDGGYFQQDEVPNVYEENTGSDGCAADAGALGRAPSACREWERPTDWWPDPDFWTSEPGEHDRRCRQRRPDERQRTCPGSRPAPDRLHPERL